MDPTEDLIPPAPAYSIISSTISSGMISIDELHKQSLLVHLKPEFQLGTSSLATSSTDSTTNTLYSDDYNSIYTNLRDEDINSLRSIAEKFKLDQCLPDCAQVYIERRRNIVDLIWTRLHQKVNFKTLYYDQVLKKKIQWWIQVAKLLLGNIFLMEKSFYEKIFVDLGPPDVGDGYVHIIGESATKLFEFVGLLAAGKELPEKLELLLPLYQELHDNMPNVDILFQKDLHLAKMIHAKATKIVFHIAQILIRILSSFDGRVLHEVSIVPALSGGKLHTTAEYVMRYIDLISKYKSSLTDLIVTSDVFSCLTVIQRNMGDTDREFAPLIHHVAQVLESLLLNLEYKYNVYKNESLRHFFMMNNVHHIVQRIKTSLSIQEIVVQDFQTKLATKADQAMYDYLRTTWDKVCKCLETEKPKSFLLCQFSIFVYSTKAMKKNLKTFKDMIEDIHKSQIEWIVQDKNLRDKLHRSILDMLIPVYTAFLEQYGCHAEKVQNPRSYIDHSVKYLEHNILNLFKYEEPWWK